MKTDDTQRPITQREFYSTVGTIYILIGLVALNTIRPGDKVMDLLRTIPAFAVGFGGVLAGLLCVVKSVRGGQGAKDPADSGK